MMTTFARDEVDAFLAELPPRVADFAELELWRIDRIRTLATHVQHELADNGDEESAVLYQLAVAAEAVCWHPCEPEAIEDYLAYKLDATKLGHRIGRNGL